MYPFGRAFCLVSLVVACGGAHPPESLAPAPDVTPPLTSAPSTRVWLLPPLPDAWPSWTHPLFLGRTASGEDLRGVGGVRFTVGPRGIAVAPQGLPAAVRAAARLDQGGWFFLLADGQVWRSAVPLGVASHLGALVRADSFDELTRTAETAQPGALSFARRGEAFVSWGEWPPEAIPALPSGITGQIVGDEDGRLYARLSGGRVLQSADRAETWTPVALPWPITELRHHAGEVEVARWHADGMPRWVGLEGAGAVPLPHAPPAGIDLVRAVAAVYPRAAGVLGVPLPEGRAVFLMDDQDAVVIRPRIRAEVMWGVVEPGWGLRPWMGEALAEPSSESMGGLRSRDGVHWATASPRPLWHFEPRNVSLRCAAGRRELSCGTSRFAPESGVERFRLVRAEDALEIRRGSTDEDGAEPLAALPGAPRARVTFAGEGGPAVLAARHVWTPDAGVVSLPDSAHSAVALTGGRLLAWGRDLRHLFLFPAAGGWQRIASSASPAPLGGENPTCAGERCVFRTELGPVVVVELGLTTAAPRTRVASMPEAAWLAGERRPRRAAPRLSGRETAFGRLTLECVDRPMPAPGATGRWSLGAPPSAARSSRGVERDPRPIEHAVGDDDHFIFLRGEELSAGRRTLARSELWTVPVGLAGEVSLDAMRDGDDWRILVAHRTAARFFSSRGGRSAWFVESRGRFGLARLGGRWGVVVGGEAPSRVALYAGDAPDEPVSLQVPGLTRGASALRPCAVGVDRIRLPVEVRFPDWVSLGLVGLTIVDGEFCVYGVELQGTGGVGWWRSGGRLESRGGRLEGMVSVAGENERSLSCAPRDNAP